MRSSCARWRTERRLAPALLALLLVGAGAEAPAPAAALRALDPVQARYDAVRDVRANFEQRSFVASLGREEVARGRVIVQRPGRMRWEYTEPQPSVIVVDRDAVRMYDPAAKKLQIFPVGSGAVSPTALGFLLGDAKLRDVFELAPGVPATSGERLSFKLRPRGDAGFESLELRFEPGTLRLRESLLIDLFGNRTEVRFDAVVENAGVEEVAFSIPVPDDTEVIDLR